MAKKSRVPVTYAFGRRDRIDPKLAPMGVLKVGKNLRVRKDGRLGTRNGYVPLDMTTANGTLVAYDLHQYRGRLVANGSDAGDGFPTDVYEYLGIAPWPWRASDRYGRRATLNPFTALREIAGIPQPASGVRYIDAAAGGGYVCLIYAPKSDADFSALGTLFALVVDAATDQVVHAETLTGVGSVLELLGPSTYGAGTARVTFAGGTFYVAATSRFQWRYLRIAQFTPGTSGAFSVFADPLDLGGSGPGVTGIDLVPVTNPTVATPARIALAVQFYEQPIQVFIYGPTGTQVGATISWPSADVNMLQIEADQTDDTVSLFTVIPTNVTRLSKFNFAGFPLGGGSILLVPGASGSICRLPALGLLPERIAVAINDLTNNVSITVYELDTHLAYSSVVVYNALLSTRLVSGQSAGQSYAVVFGGLVAPTLPDDDQATNALFFATPSNVHVAYRDYVKAIDHTASDHKQINLTLDASTGELCWPALFDPGVDDVAMPVVSLVKFQSHERRQGVSFGSLYYEAGAAMSVYDGRYAAELGFGEAPGIVSLTGSNSVAHASVATLTGTFIEPGQLDTIGKNLVFAIDIGGTVTTKTISTPTFLYYGLSILGIDNLINAQAPGVLLATTVDGKLTVSTVAVGADVSLTLKSGTMASVVGLEHLIGRPFYGSAALRPGATYYYTVHFEHVLADRSVMLGPPSIGGSGQEDDFKKAASVTLASGQSKVTAVVTTPHSLRVAQGDALYGGDITAVLSRTQWFPYAGSGGSVFQRCVAKRVPVGMANYGKLLTIVDEVPDDHLADNESLYTQGARGAVSGPLEQNAPRACKYITATESRLITAGLGRETLSQVSRDAFTSESMSFSDRSEFLSQVAGKVVGVQSLDSARFIFTTDKIYAVTGAGPDDLGGGGFDPPVEIPTPSGLSNVWSFLEAPDGLWFQLDDSKLFRIPRGGGAPTWEGVDVEDTLIEFSTIVGTCKHKRDNVAVFACCNPGGSTDNGARFLVRDFRTENWFEDTPVIAGDIPLGVSAVTAITSHADTLAYITLGVVYVQSTGFVDGDGSFIDTQVRTHPLYPFGVGGYGQIYELLLTGEYRGDCQIGCRVSYDDGQTFTDLASFELFRLTAGETIQRKWTLPQDVTSSIVIEFSITQSEDEEAGPSEGFVFNQVDLLVEVEDGLRELSPGEMA